MNRDDIYDHLAQVYLGKKNKSEQKEKAIHILARHQHCHHGHHLREFRLRPDRVLDPRGPFPSKVIYTSTTAIRISYNLEYPFPPVKTFLFRPRDERGKVS